MAGNDRELLRRYHEDGDLYAREKLIEQYMSLVRSLARRYSYRGEQLEDLVQIGAIGLIKAIDRFDLERGVELTTYATPNIIGEIKRHFRDKGWSVRVPRGLQELNVQLSRLIEQLTVHTYIENEVMYPQVRALLPELDEDVLESYEEHHVADVLCMELAAMAPDAEHFDAKATVLIENVSHHIEEEEQDWFPKVRVGLSRKQLQDIGARLEQARRKAPSTPSQPSALKKTIDAVIS